jgi:hypothetical protein
MRPLMRMAAVFTALAATGALPAGAQQQPQALVIEGGMLIDGNGGAPLANSVVIVQGNRIAAVSRIGQTQYPAGARIIDARGKWVLPGLWDAQTNYSWFYGELNLHQGVTSTLDVGLGEELSILHREAVNRGRIRGPRRWIGIGYAGNVDPKEITGYETPLGTRALPKTVEEVRQFARRRLDAGTDVVMFHDGHSFTPEMVRAGCDEAHARGKPCSQRPDNPRADREVMGPREAALAGADFFPHSQGVGGAVARDGFYANNELDRYAQMDDAKARALIDVMVRENVYNVPNIIHVSPGYPKDWDRMYAAVRQAFTDPNLLAYYPDEFLKEMTQVRSGIDSGEVRARRLPGYRNMMRFNKLLVDAGGKVMVGGDTNGSKVPGFAVDEEMEIFQEAGIGRMQIIQAATKWPAEALRVVDRIGTVDAGKLADMIIVNADPLADISNIRQVETVILDGKVTDRAFHAWYDTPFRGMVDDVRVVEALPWTATLKAATFEAGNARQPPNPADSPQPAIQAISPVWAKEGDPSTTVKLTGFNFVARTRVYFDGVSVPWKWISATELEVILDDYLLRRPGRFDLVVKNPQPVALPHWGDGTSNKAHFLIDFRY